MTHFLMHIVLSLILIPLSHAGFVEIRDLRDHTADKAVYKKLALALRNCRNCYEKGVSFLPYGANETSFTQNNKALSAVEYQAAEATATGYRFYLQSFVLIKKGQMYLRRLTLDLNGRNVKLVEAENLNLHDGQWEINVYGWGLYMTLENKALGFKAYYPIVSPGFKPDLSGIRLPPNKTYLMQRLGKNGQGEVGNIYSRIVPDYYRGYPFIRMANSNLDRTVFGIHSPMQAGDMRRGYLSAGCIRVRVSDLYQFYHLVRELNNKSKIVVNVHHSYGEPNPHPYPFFDKFHTVADFTAPKGEGGVTFMQRIYAPAPEL